MDDWIRMQEEERRLAQQREEQQREAERIRQQQEQARIETQRIYDDQDREWRERRLRDEQWDARLWTEQRDAAQRDTAQRLDRELREREWDEQRVWQQQEEMRQEALREEARRVALEQDGRFAFHAQQGGRDCFRTCQRMLDGYGTRVGGHDERLQIAARARDDGYVDTSAGLHPSARAAYDYLDRELDRGRPVVVGVTYSSSGIPRSVLDQNRDGMTDHFVVVTGYSGAGDDRRYTFRDPGSSVDANNHGELRFQDGLLVKDGSGSARYTTGCRYEVTQVRPNFGR